MPRILSQTPTAIYQRQLKQKKLEEEQKKKQGPKIIQIENDNHNDTRACRAGKCTCQTYREWVASHIDSHEENSDSE